MVNGHEFVKGDDGIDVVVLSDIGETDMERPVNTCVSIVRAEYVEGCPK